MNLYEILSENSSFTDAMNQVSDLPIDYSGDPEIPSVTDYSTDWTPPPFADVAKNLGCLDCDSQHLGWCSAIPGKDFYNARYLRACPRTQPIEMCLPVLDNTL